MVTVSKPELLDRVLQAFRSAGWQVQALETDHPFLIRARRGPAEFKFRIFIWNTTHGGGSARSPGEFRIQITGVDIPLALRPDEEVLLLGWHEPLGVFVAFDPSRHHTPSHSSPSLQVPLGTLERATERGRARHLKGSGEIVWAVLPDQLTRYAVNHVYLHRSAEEPESMLDELDPPTSVGQVAFARAQVETLAGRQGGGQRHLQSQVDRQAIENHSMAVARDYFENRGWIVEDVSRFAPYDLRCTSSGEVELHVEVKGTTSQGETVLLTPNEVVHARSTSATPVLFLVSEIRLAEGSVAHGGHTRIIWPWGLEPDTLRAIGYEYPVPDSAGSVSSGGDQ